jgi:hypothetical protein
VPILLIASIAGFVSVTRSVDADGPRSELVSVSSSGAAADFGATIRRHDLNDGNRIAFASLSRQPRRERYERRRRVFVRAIAGNGVSAARTGSQQQARNPRSARTQRRRFRQRSDNLVAGDRNPPTSSSTI